MTFTRFVEFEIRTTGSDTNGGGFAPGGTGVNYSRQNSPQYAVTDAVHSGTGFNITSATANFGTDVVGNICYFAGGSGNAIPRWWQITARVNSTTITVDTRAFPPSAVATTGATLNIGGALATPGTFGHMFSQQPGEGMIGWLQKGTYQITSNTANISGGKISLHSGSGYSSGLLVGYDTIRGDRTGIRPLIQSTSGITGTLIALSNYQALGSNISNLEIDGANQSGSRGVSHVTGANANAGSSFVRDCVVRNCTTGFDGSPSTEGVMIIACQAISCTTGILNLEAMYCEAISCTTGFSRPLTNRTTRSLRRCVAKNCTTGFSVAFANLVSNCLAVGGVTGFTNPVASFDPPLFLECIAAGCSGRGWDLGKGYNIDCATFNCGQANILPPTSGDTGTLTPWLTDSHFILTADPFIDSANGDYRLNNVAGGGAVLRNGGLKLPSQVLASDIGPLQGVYGSGGGGGSYSPIDNILIG